MSITLSYHDHAALSQAEHCFRLLYGERAASCMARLYTLLGRYNVAAAGSETPWTEKTAMLITYGDMVRNDAEPPLRTLQTFADTYLKDLLSHMHILPFFPYSSDEGFSVLNFRTVNPDLGTWADVERLGASFQLAFDLVLNHASSRSGWFIDYLAGVAPGRDYFVEADPQTDLSQVVRPRTSPLLTAVKTRYGQRHVWTTFSADQVDLNYASPDLLFEMLDIMLFYVSKGCRLLRLDAVAFLWKKAGTSCVHLPETHAVVQLMRSILRIASPQAWLLTETNVPHRENVSYFGDGQESHIVYQFALPPLTLHALLSEDATTLTRWAKALQPPPAGCTFLNFTASHDGIGLRPAEDWLDKAALEKLVDQVTHRGGLVSYRTGPDGMKTPYELNTTWYSALSDDAPGSRTHVDRFICSQAIMLALQGIPALYFNTLLAAPNDDAAVGVRGYARAINRTRWQWKDLVTRLQEAHTKDIFERLRRLMTARSHEPAFHPDAPQRILDGDPRLFSIVRSSPDGRRHIWAVHNVSSQTVRLTTRALGMTETARQDFTDLISAEPGRLTPETGPDLPPFGVCWMIGA